MAIRQRGKSWRERSTGRPWGYRVMALLLALLLAWGTAGCASTEEADPEEQTESEENSSGPKLKYASQGVTAIDEDSLQKSVNELMKADEGDRMALYYKNNAYSTDGNNFTCFIGNSPANPKDAYFVLCKDSELEDVVYISDLLRPGEAFESLTLEDALGEGSHTIYCGQTMVNENQEITNQLVFTLQFNVSYEGF